MEHTIKQLRAYFAGKLSRVCGEEDVCSMSKTMIDDNINYSSKYFVIDHGHCSDYFDLDDTDMCTWTLDTMHDVMCELFEAQGKRIAPLIFRPGTMPLHAAAKANDANLCELLVAAGAPVDALDDKGMTALDVAIMACPQSAKAVRGTIGILVRYVCLNGVGPNPAQVERIVNQRERRKRFIAPNHVATQQEMIDPSSVSS